MPLVLNDVLFGKPEPIDDTPPSSDDVNKAMAIQCLQGPEDREPKHTLASLVEGFERAILVFIRHHHCGMCVKYVQALAEQTPLKETTTKEQKAVKVLVIGHGSHEGIKHYREISQCPFDMYVDEQKQLYSALGLTRRFLGKGSDEETTYMGGDSVASVVGASIKEMVASGSLAWKGGDVKLLGGEFVIDKGGHTAFVHRMRDTSDHSDPVKLAEYAKLPSQSST